MEARPQYNQSKAHFANECLNLYKIKVEDLGKSFKSVFDLDLPPFYDNDFFPIPLFSNEIKNSNAPPNSLIRDKSNLSAENHMTQSHISSDTLIEKTESKSKAHTIMKSILPKRFFYDKIFSESKPKNNSQAVDSSLMVKNIAKNNFYIDGPPFLRLAAWPAPNPMDFSLDLSLSSSIPMGLTELENNVQIQLKSLDYEISKLFRYCLNGLNDWEEICYISKTIADYFYVFLKIPAIEIFLRSPLAKIVEYKSFPNLVHLTKLIFHLTENILNSINLDIPEDKFEYLSSIREKLLSLFYKIGMHLNLLPFPSNEKYLISNYDLAFAANYKEYSLTVGDKVGLNNSKSNLSSLPNSFISPSKSFTKQNFKYNSPFQSEIQLDPLDTSTSIDDFNSVDSISIYKANKDQIKKNQIESSADINSEFFLSDSSSTLKHESVNSDKYSSFNVLVEVFEKLSKKIKSSEINDKKGSYIACVARGFSQNFCILTVIFGTSKWNPAVKNNINFLAQYLPDVHIIWQDSSIIPFENEYGDSNFSRQKEKTYDLLKTPSTKNLENPLFFISI